jgi:hypothetical protein
VPGGRRGPLGGVGTAPRQAVVRRMARRTQKSSFSPNWCGRMYKQVVTTHPVCSVLEFGPVVPTSANTPGNHTSRLVNNGLRPLTLSQHNNTTSALSTLYECTQSHVPCPRALVPHPREHRDERRRAPAPAPARDRPWGQGPRAEPPVSNLGSTPCPHSSPPLPPPAGRPSPPTSAER